MKLWLTRRHWEKLARTDPLWAVLTDESKVGNQWDHATFFATGERDVSWVMNSVNALSPELRRTRALDFGCGPGRLTQALSQHFAHATGIDISETMLALAQRHNRAGARVTYMHNARSDLGCFADGSFDFVLSMITLQHVPPQSSRRYIAEFVRVLARGGIVWFQMPARSKFPVSRRFSLWPPTLAKRVVRAFNRYTAASPLMEMYVLPRDEVTKILLDAGAEILAVQPHESAGPDFESFVYIARKL
jgi:ubiquinone/menaquinone biosynthesis C-methylase UbiE